jgi:hypothetical protein
MWLVDAVVKRKKILHAAQIVSALAYRNSSAMEGAFPAGSYGSGKYFKEY